MTPIDDELRAALQGRASALAPSPDPLAGIERRAQRIRRTRIGAAVAASALAVSAIAVAVPVLQNATSSGSDRPAPFATSGPTSEPTAPRSDLVPTDPWAYRGADLELLGPGTLDTIERELGIKHGTNDVELTPLFGQVWEPSQKFELVYLATVDGELRWGVSQTPTESGPEFVVDRALYDDSVHQFALVVVLEGDDVPRMIVVAAPGTTAEYSPDRSSGYRPMAELADGVATVALEGPEGSDSFQILAADGTRLVRSGAPRTRITEPSSGNPTTTLDPEQPWGTRGDRSLVTNEQLESLGQDWATRNGIDAEVELVPLYVQRYEADAGVEVVYLVRSGDGPWTWGVATLGEGGWALYAENEITEPLTALAAALPDAGDQGAERLLVVAAPSVGGGMYAADGDDFRPMTDLAPGIFATSISPGDADDAYLVLDGDGDLDNPVFRGPVPDFQNAG